MDKKENLNKERVIKEENISDEECADETMRNYSWPSEHRPTENEYELKKESSEGDYLKEIKKEVGSNVNTKELIVCDGIVGETIPNKTPDKLLRKDLTLANKIAVLDEIKNHLPASHRKLAEITGVPKSTIARLIVQEDKLREEWALCEGQKRTSLKRKREGKYPDIEEALNQWFSVVNGGVHVTGPILRRKSEELAKTLGHKNFKATDGWLSRWKSKHIKVKIAPVEKSSTNTVSGEHWEATELPNLLQSFFAEVIYNATPDGSLSYDGKKDKVDVGDLWRATKLPNLFQKFCSEDIYNAKETGLLYRVTPDGSLTYAHEALSGLKKAMDHVTVLCCANMLGTDKRKLLVTGKNTSPRCFKGLRIESLPVAYHANTNAWMTSEIFKEWLKSWDLELQQTSRKVLLLLEDCAAHPHLECLKNIHLEFLPPSTPSLAEPMHMGIIQNLKMLYRGKLVNYILEAIEENHLTSSSSAKEVSAKVNLLLAIQLLSESWLELSSKTIHNCFSNCDFKPLSYLKTLDVIDTESDSVLGVQNVRNYKEFLCIDDRLQCYNENEYFEDKIVAKDQMTLEDQESDEDDAPELEPVTSHDARKCISALRRYFMQEGNGGSPVSSLNICAEFVQSRSLKTWQMALNGSNSS